MLAGFSDKDEMLQDQTEIMSWIKENGLKDKANDKTLVSNVARTIYGWNEARRRQSTGTWFVLAEYVVVNTAIFMSAFESHLYAL